MTTATPTAVAPEAARRGDRASWVWLPLAIFLATRLVDAVILMVLGREQSALDPVGMHVESQPGAHPGYWGLLANWDGQWFRTVAEHGYPAELPRDAHGNVEQNAWAFSPLYPFLVRSAMVLGQLPFGVAASLVSVASGALAMVLLFRLVAETGGRLTASLLVLGLCLAPAAPVLQAAYSESLCLLLVVACLWLLRRRRYGALAVGAVLLSLTRPLVLPLALVVLVHGLLRWRRREADPFPLAERVRCATAAVVTVLSFGLWPLVAALRTGEPRAYLDTYDAWAAAGPGRTSWLARLADPNDFWLGLFPVVLLALLAAIVLAKRARAWGEEPRAWTLAYAVYLAAVTPPSWSDARHALLTLLPWWPFPFPLGEKVTRATVVVIVVGMIAIGVPLQYLWVRSFYVVGPHGLGFA